MMEEIGWLSMSCYFLMNKKHLSTVYCTMCIVHKLFKAQLFTMQKIKKKFERPEEMLVSGGFLQFSEWFPLYVLCSVHSIA